MVSMSDNTVKDTRASGTAKSDFNALSYMIETLINQLVFTADVVKVLSVSGGYVDVMPLVTQIDAFDNAVQPAPLYHLPYNRVQGGRAALIIDPVPGDIGLAVFAKRDSSGVMVGQTDPVKPASFRTFNQADGFYFGGFLNQTPEVFLELTQGGEAILTAPTKVTVNTATADVNANGICNINAPMTNVSGNLAVAGQLAVTGGISGGGGATMTGGITNTGGTVTSNGITLETHIHGGVQSGGSQTGGPQ